MKKQKIAARTPCTRIPKVLQVFPQIIMYNIQLRHQTGLYMHIQITWHYVKIAQGDFTEDPFPHNAREIPHTLSGNYRKALNITQKHLTLLSREHAYIYVLLYRYMYIYRCVTQRTFHLQPACPRLCFTRRRYIIICFSLFLSRCTILCFVL